MFFFSDKNDNSHKFWGKLDKAGLMEKPVVNTSLNKIGKRKAEADERKKKIMGGNTSSDYVLGLTTFYSFPTPVRPEKRKENSVKFDYGDAQGVERLFQHCLDKVRKMEYDRINSYDFAKNAFWIFTQNSSYRYVQGFSRIDYWPLRGDGSSGKDLQEILLMPWKT